MRIGVPTEIKTLEGRVALTPNACNDLIRHGHQVYLQSGAGKHSGYDDSVYRQLGVEIMENAETLYQKVQLIVKVKEPQAAELPYLRSDHLLFCYLHLAAEPALTQALCDIGLTAVAFETLEVNGSLPLLAPMSIVAGRLAVQIGTHLLHRPQGGKGIMLGGLHGTDRGHVVVLGAGAAGGAAAALAAAGGAAVTVYDKNPQRLAEMHALSPNIQTRYPYAERIEKSLSQADLVVGAVLVTGARAPVVIKREAVENMQAGSVIIDISVDQGGCIETTHPTTYADPTYDYAGVTHFAVTNMPGAVPKTSAQALSAVITPYVHALTRPDWRNDPVLCTGINVETGEIVHPGLLQ